MVNFFCNKKIWRHTSISLVAHHWAAAHPLNNYGLSQWFPILCHLACLLPAYFHIMYPFMLSKKFLLLYFLSFICFPPLSNLSRTPKLPTAYTQGYVSLRLGTTVLSHHRPIDLVASFGQQQIISPFLTVPGLSLYAVSVRKVNDTISYLVL